VRACKDLGVANHMRNESIAVLYEGADRNRCGYVNSADRSVRPERNTCKTVSKSGRYLHEPSLLGG
jgi:hypothetical protein